MHPSSSRYQVARTSAEHGLGVPHCLPRSSRVPHWCLERLHRLQLSHVGLDTVWLVASGFHQLLLEECGAELWRQTGFEVIQSHILERILDIKQSNFYKMLSFLFRIWPAAYCDEVCPISWKNALFLWEHVCPFQACPDVHTSLFLLPCWVETSLHFSEISLDLGEVQTLSKHGRKGT